MQKVAKTMVVLAALHFDDQLRVHAKCTDISVSPLPRRELGELFRSRFLARTSLSRYPSCSFSPFFPRSRSQILTYDYAFVRTREFRPKVDVAEGADSRTSEVTERQWGSEAVAP